MDPKAEDASAGQGVADKAGQSTPGELEKVEVEKVGVDREVDDRIDGNGDVCLVVQQGELAPRTQEHPSQERVGTSMLTQCTLGFEVIHPYNPALNTIHATHGQALTDATHSDPRRQDDPAKAGDGQSV